MKRSHFVIKPYNDGYGIFLRSMQLRPLATYPTRKLARQRLTQYLKRVNANI